MPSGERPTERDCEDPMQPFMYERGRIDNPKSDRQTDEFSFGRCFEEVSCYWHFGPTVDGTISEIGR